jgi:hypothetical protein
MIPFMFHTVHIVQVQLLIAPSSPPLVPLEHIEIQFVSHFLPMQRSRRIFPALLLHGHEAMEAAQATPR